MSFKRVFVRITPRTPSTKCDRYYYWPTNGPVNKKNRFYGFPPGENNGVKRRR